jgi:hypothetical protein
MHIRHLIGLLLPLAFAAQVHAECSASSGPQRAALLELYTSEGCSSCPPADRWLSSFAKQGVGHARAVPLALHVDYWDYIGWQDRFAKPAFTSRQREMALLGNSRLVYTPQVLLNGRDQRNWRSHERFERELAAINRTPPQAVIRLSVEHRSNVLDLSVEAKVAQEGTHALYMAVYENDLVSIVKTGENAGATLHHDFVVRGWLGPFALSSKASTSRQQQIEFDQAWKIKSLGIAAFVQNTATGEVLQAVSLPLCAR